MILVAAAGIGILLFICGFIGFKQGLRLGMLAAKGQVPAKVDPVGAVKQVDKDKTKSELLKGYEAMMAFTGEPKREV